MDLLRGLFMCTIVLITTTQFVPTRTQRMRGGVSFPNVIQLVSNHFEALRCQAMPYLRHCRRFGVWRDPRGRFRMGRNRWRPMPVNHGRRVVIDNRRDMPREPTPGTFPPVRDSFNERERQRTNRGRESSWESTRRQLSTDHEHHEHSRPHEHTHSPVNNVRPSDHIDHQHNTAFNPPGPRQSPTVLQPRHQPPFVQRGNLHPSSVRNIPERPSFLPTFPRPLDLPQSPGRREDVCTTMRTNIAGRGLWTRGPIIDSNISCSPGMTLYNGTCHSTAGESLCAPHCPDGFRCHHGHCDRSPCQKRCTGGLRCIEGRCLDGDRCMKPCCPGQICRRGQCVDKPRESAARCNPACPDNYVCKDGVCTRANLVHDFSTSECHPPCGPGQQCHDGHCEANSNHNTPTSGCFPPCGPGQHCHDGHCEAEHEPPPAADICPIPCSPGTHCHSGQCVPDSHHHVIPNIGIPPAVGPGQSAGGTQNSFANPAVQQDIDLESIFGLTPAQGTSGSAGNNAINQGVNAGILPGTATSNDRLNFLPSEGAFPGNSVGGRQDTNSQLSSDLSSSGGVPSSSGVGPVTGQNNQFVDPIFGVIAK